ncbi:hypothetical protein [Gordonia sp. (in: high G+C Gram-positive bacteria)]|uniref:hypothetical protein n=1 Tax=Gordonia sp. (in: high G+C Gram-positive bacteria) TaxID=84139 RepID=UPI0039E660BA
MKNATRFAGLAGATAVALTALVAPPAAHAAPPPVSPATPGKYVTHETFSGYIDVTSMRLTDRTLRFTARFISTRGEFPVNRLYFSAKGGGTTYRFPTSNLPTRRLASGDRTMGVVSFQVNGPRPTIVSYRDAQGHLLATWPVRSTLPPRSGSSGSSGS